MVARQAEMANPEDDFDDSAPIKAPTSVPPVIWGWMKKPKDIFMFETSLVLYAATSFLLAIFVASSKRMPSVNWGSAELRRNIGSPTSNQGQNSVERSAELLSSGASSVSVGGGAALLLLAASIFSAAVATTYIPTLFGSMKTVTAINIAALVTVGLSWMYITYRIFLTVLALSLAVAAAVFMVALFLAPVYAVAVFATGGTDKSSVHSFAKKLFLDEQIGVAEIQSQRMRDKEIEFNGCVLLQGVLSLGSIDVVKQKCKK